jgi:excisionase family DNA binding protein
MADLPLVLTVEETAEALRIGRSAAYEGIRTGQIPAVRIGRNLRVPRHALEQLLGLTAVGTDSPHENGAVGAAPQERKMRHERRRTESTRPA